MRKSDHITETYLLADGERRLNLFLECPAQRESFIEIETREASTKKASISRTSFWKRLFSYSGTLSDQSGNRSGGACIG